MTPSRLSRILSHALRHEPWIYELELDAEGWAPLNSVMSAISKEFPEISDLSDTSVCEMIEESSKRRHEVKDGRIRALYGHSLPGRLKRSIATPPRLLYHGTSHSALAGIRLSGLLPMGRQYVHLSVDEPTALQVARRKSDRALILQISASDAHLKGIPFYEGNEKVWLADLVPAEFIFFQET